MDRPNNRELLRHHLLIVLIAGLVFFTNLGSSVLFDEDEPKNAVCGREMFLRGDWVVPTFNAELRTDKPILIYWIMLCSYSVFGISEFAARFGSSFLAVGTCLLTYHLGRKLFDGRTGLLAAIVLCTSLMFSAVGRAVTPDSTLIFCTTLAFFLYVRSVTNRFGGQYGEPEFGSLRRRTWDEYASLLPFGATPMYLAMGLAVLAKGPIGVLLPCSIIGLNLLVRQQMDRAATLTDSSENVPPTPSTPRSWVASFWQGLQQIGRTFHPARIGAGMLAMYVPWGAIIVALVALPWYVMVGQETDGAWLAGFLGNHNVGRFLEPKENHSGPIFYYAFVILLGTFPWSAFLPVAVWQLVKQLRNGTASPALVFVACWAGFWIAFFSLASTKLPNYILPSYPAVALIVAQFLVSWQRSVEPGFYRRALLAGCWTAAGVGAVLMVAIPIVTSLFLPDESWLIVIALIPLIGGLLALRAVQRGRRNRALHLYATTAVLLAVTIVGIAPAYVSRYQDGPYFGEMARQVASDKTPELATYDYFAPNLVFYAQTPVEKLKQADDIPTFFGSHPEGLLLTREDRLETLKAHLPADVTVLAQQRRFLRRHDLVLLGRTSQVQAVQAVSRTQRH